VDKIKDSREPIEDVECGNISMYSKNYNSNTYAAVDK